MDDLKNSHGMKAVMYEEDGHLYTTFIVAVRAGKPVHRALELAWGSQIPDLNGRYSATRAALRYWFSRYAKRLMKTLHSLHGQGEAGVAKRRADLKALIADAVGRGMPDWQVGLMVHAYADSYAHTHLHNGREEAYSSPLGHAGDGHTPDKIASFPNKFLAYATNLYEAFGGQEDARSALARLVAIVSDPAGRDEIADRIKAYAGELGMAGAASDAVREQLLDNIGADDVDATMRMMEERFGLAHFADAEEGLASTSVPGTP